MAREFKQIPEAPDYYISNRGEVLSKRVDGKEKMMTMHKNNTTGYMQVVLCIEDKPSRVTKTFYPHQVVAKLFIPNPKGYDRVNHIDHNKINNHIHNLEWCTQAHNIQAYYKSNQKDKPREMKAVEVWSVDGHYIKTFPSINQCSIELKVNPSTVWKGVKGLVKSPKKYEFRYAENV